MCTRKRLVTDYVIYQNALVIISIENIFHLKIYINIFFRNTALIYTHLFLKLIEKQSIISEPIVIVSNLNDCTSLSRILTLKA